MSAKLSVKNTIKICIITISLLFVLLSASFAGAFMRDIGDSIPTVETAFAADVDGGEISNPVFGKNTFSTGALTIPETETNGEKDAITYRIDFPINDDHDDISASGNYYYGNINEDYRVAYALYDPYVDVNFNFEADLNGSAAIAIYFYAEDGSRLTQFGISEPENIKGSNTISYTVTHDNSAEGQLCPAYMVIEISTYQDYTTEVGGTVSNASVTITAQTDLNALDTASAVWNVSVSGSNRSTDVLAMNYNDTVYVKSTDTVTVTYNQGGVEYSHLFTAIFDTFGDTGCIDWFSAMQSGTARAPLSRDDDSMYQKYGGTGAITNDVYYGYSTQFYAGNLPTAGVITLVARVPSQIDANGQVLYTDLISAGSITLVIDRSAPSAPRLDTAADTQYAFGQSLVNGTWFTSQTVAPQYASVTGNVVSPENVYAYVVNANISTTRVDEVLPTVNLGPDTGDVAAHSFSYTVNGVSYSATRQSLGEYSNEPNADKEYIDFSEEAYKDNALQPGQLGLLLVAVDKAGNYMYWLYSNNGSSDGGNVGSAARVDWTTRSILPGFTVPGSSELIYGSATAAYASVYVLAGDAYHNLDGDFIGGAFLPDSGLNACRDNGLAISRIANVTLRIVMNPDQYNAANIVDYEVEKAAGMLGTPVFKDMVVGNVVYRYFDLTFETDDGSLNSWWGAYPATEDAAYRYFYATVHERVIPTLAEGADQLVYSNGSQREISTENVQMTLVDGSNLPGANPAVSIQYFKRQTMTVYSNASSGHITTGGYIQIDGERVFTGADQDMNAYFRTGISYDFTVGESNRTYYVYEITSNWQYQTDGAGNYTGLAIRTAYVLELTAPNATGGFIDAGTYYYRLFVDDNSADNFYYGETIAQFEIRKAAANPFNAGAYNTLKYGQSLDELLFYSYLEDRTTMIYPAMPEGWDESMTVGGFPALNINGTYYPMYYDIEGTRYYYTAGGVYGTFNILSPAPGDTDYIKPTTEDSVHLLVEFVPITMAFDTNVIREHYTYFFVHYYNNTTYTLKTGTPHAGNFSSVTFEIDIDIENRLVQLQPSADDTNYDTKQGKYIYTYDELQHQPLFSGTYKNEDGETVYVPTSELSFVMVFGVLTDGQLTDILPAGTYPQNAGDYMVFVSVNPLECNYDAILQGEGDMQAAALFNLTILKQQVTVELADYSSDADGTGWIAGAGQLTYGGVNGEVYEYSNEFRYIYDHLRIPEFRSLNAAGNMVGLGYSYALTRLQYFDAEGNVRDLQSPEVSEPQPTISNTGINAGVYIVTVGVNNPNYEGYCVIKYNVVQGNYGNNEYFQLIQPQLSQRYGDSILGSAHMEFGMSLEEVAALLTGGQVNFDAYDAALGSVQRSIAGRFYFAPESNYPDTFTYIDADGTEHTVLDVKYNSLNRYNSHDVTLYWEAGSYVGDEFVPDYNFSRTYTNLSVIVAKANISISEVSPTDLIYGERLSAVDFKGYVTAAGNRRFEIDADGKIAGMGTLSFAAAETAPAGGIYNAVLNFIPDGDEVIARYYGSESLALQITVAKRQVKPVMTPNGEVLTADDLNGEINAGESVSDALFRIYGNGLIDPQFTMSAAAVGDRLPAQDNISTVTVDREYHYYTETTGSVYDLKHNGKYYLEISDGIQVTSPVGKYLVKLVLTDNNYEGECIADYYVIKATLLPQAGYIPEFSIEYSDNINGLTFAGTLNDRPTSGGTVTEFYGKFEVVAYITYVDGEQVTVPLTDRYNGLPVNTDDRTENVVVRFEPDVYDRDNYDRNFRPFESDYRLIVNRKDISEDIFVDPEIVNAENEVSLVFANDDKFVGLAAIDEAAFADDPKGADSVNVALNYLINGTVVHQPGTVTDAGTYSVRVSIEEEGSDYCGYKDYTVTVLPHEVFVTNGYAEGQSAVMHPYNGTGYAFIPRLEFAPGDEILEIDPAALAYSVTYILYNDPSPIAAPTEIGSYYMDISLDNQNYILRSDSGENVSYGVRMQLYIHPNIIGLQNAEQIYSPLGTAALEVAPVYVEHHPVLYYNISYSRDGEAVVSPTDAGYYDVEIDYNFNGMSWSYFAAEGLHIAPYVTDNFLDAKYSHVYDGSVYLIQDKHSLLYNLQNEAEFSYYSVTDGDYVTEPINAGIYNVSATVSDGNFAGSESQTVLEITAAPLTFRGNVPSVSMYFGTSAEQFNVILKDLGTFNVMDPLGNPVPGAFVIDDSDDTANLIATFPVGNRRIDIIYVPGMYVEGEKGELCRRNYQSFADDISVSILKRNIESYISVIGEPVYMESREIYYIAVPYNRAAQPLSYIVSDGETEYNVQVNLTYNDSRTAPVSVGEYLIGGAINDAAYDGSYPGVLHGEDENGNAVYKPLYLIIERAVPTVDYSNLRVIIDGNSYSRVPLVVTNNALQPVTLTMDMITGLTANIGSGANVEGTFAFVGDSATIRKANENYIEVRFDPVDSESYSYVSTEIIIMGDGGDPKVSYVEKQFEYGETFKNILQQSAFTASLDPDGSFAFYSDKYGAEKLPEDYIASVGEEIDYVFTPSAEKYALFNVVRGTFVPVGVKQVVELDEIKAFGYMFMNGGFAADDLHFVFEIYADGKLLEGFDYTVQSFTEMDGSSAVAGEYLTGNNITIAFEHPDYELCSAEGNKYIYTLRNVYVYNLIETIDSKTEKVYDGNALTMDELDIRAADTSVPIAFNIDQVVFNGETVTEGLKGVVNAGTYTIYASVKGEAVTDDLPDGVIGGKYFGSFKITFTITPFDVSDYIEIYGTKKTYGETIRIYAEVNGVSVPDEAFEMRYYTSDMASLGNTVPVDAGRYYVVAVWVGNGNYTGSAETEYVIEKAAATVSFTDMNSDTGYVFSYDGLTHAAKVTVSDNLTAADVIITYYNSNGNEVSVPGNPGVYRVVAEISDNNHFGSAETTLTINRAEIRVTTYPTVDAIKYGTKVGAANVSSNFVVHTTGFDSVVAGRFEAVAPDAILNAGTHSVQYRFVPELDYYNPLTVTLTVTVEKAAIAIEVMSPTEYPLIYDGTPKQPVVISDSGISYRVQFRNEAGVALPTAPTPAGNYSVTYTIDDVNYTGTNTVEFTIEKASLLVDQSVLPISVDVRYGAKISSGIFSGTMVYVNGAGGISGSFVFDDGEAVLGNVGVYPDRGYTFIPNDSANYSSYRGKVDVNVIKANALVTGNNVFNYVYGDDLTEEAPYLTFTTEPGNMNLVSADFDEWIDGLTNGITDGLVTRTFTATVDNQNYTGSREFTIIINPRPVKLVYRIMGTGGVMTEVTDQITVNFGAATEFSVGIDISSLPPGLLTSDEINQMQNGLIVRYHDYVDIMANLGEGSTVRPNAVGEYIVSVSMGLTNLFTVDEETKYIDYTVNRGNVESIAFNTAVLTQTYGNSITVPGVITVPGNIAVEVRFDGLEYIPDTAGEYPISAVVVDPNYNPVTVNGMLRILPKEIPIINPVAYDKAYDGLANIRVTAELGGIIVGDEVTLSLTAMTENGSAEVGVHRVVLTSWTLGGLDAGNYTVREPVYNLTAKITSNIVVDPNTESYITTEGGFSSNITVDFSEVREASNETNLFTRLFGQKATVQTISIRENGINKVLDKRVKFYVRIPDEYLGSKNLVVEGLGNLANVSSFTREGNYITFYADTSGEIVFYTTDFPYWIIIVIAVIAIVVLGIIVILIAAPLRRRKRIPDGARKIYKWRKESGSVEEAYRRKVKAQIEDKKRKWRY